MPVSFSYSIRQPPVNVTTFHGKSCESIDDFINKVHLSFTHIKDTYAKDGDKDTAHIHLIKSNSSGKAGKFIRSLPARQNTTAAVLITALRSAFDSTVEDDAREAEAHRAMLRHKQKKGEGLAKYVPELVASQNTLTRNIITS